MDEDDPLDRESIVRIVALCLASHFAKDWQGALSIAPSFLDYIEHRRDQPVSFTADFKMKD